jgi:hypothetical protein
MFDRKIKLIYSTSKDYKLVIISVYDVHYTQAIERGSRDGRNGRNGSA